MEKAIRYKIVVQDPAAHLFTVNITVASPDPEGQLFRLPTWIPGSYMIREFAGNIVQIHAKSKDKKLAITKLDKATWKTAPCAHPLIIQYEVYAWDLSVRTAHLDQTHGFYNGSSVFLQVIGQEEKAHIVDISKPAHEACQNWQVATAMPEYEAKRYGFGTYIAASYDELIDHPVEMGNFALTHFHAHGVQHDIAVTGRVPNLDIERLAVDLQKICEAQISLFEPETKQAPVDRYVFLVMAVGNGYGGLEHRASTALLCSRSDLPIKTNKDNDQATQTVGDAYQNFLGLCSHEYFHTWHVKRIKPDSFAPYDLQNENYTRQLWLFEGVTSYYDDLTLVRSKRIDVSAYLHQIARTINSVMTGSGRKKQSVADASFDAWIKFYRQNENAPNALVNYYQKGSLLAMALDLSIRHQTKNKKSLDDCMLLLWQRYGRNFAQKQRGISDTEAEALFEEASGLDLKEFFQRYVHGTEDLPLSNLLAPFGIDLNTPQENEKASLNIRVNRTSNDCKIVTVYEGGAAHKAGLSAGDVLIAIDGLRVSGENPAANLEKLLSRYPVGASVEIHTFRRDELMTFHATLLNDQTPQFTLSLTPKQSVSAIAARGLWLNDKST